MRRIYLTAALPLVCEFRQALRAFSLALKARTAAHQATMLPLTREERCPLGDKERVADGPLADLETIRDYFCRHPDASPEACLVHLRNRMPTPSIDTGKA